MRISDWSSDVCSSDLTGAYAALEAARVAVDQIRFDGLERFVIDLEPLGGVVAHVVLDDVGLPDQIEQDFHRARIFQIQRDRLLAAVRHVGDVHAVPRSEEHTSELQYLMRNSYAVF